MQNLAYNKQVCVSVIDFSLVERDRNVPSIGLCSINNYCEISPITHSRGFPTPTEKLQHNFANLLNC